MENFFSEVLQVSLLSKIHKTHSWPSHAVVFLKISKHYTTAQKLI